MLARSFVSLLTVAIAAVKAVPFERRGLAQVISQCYNDIAYTWFGPYDWHDEINNAFNNVGGKTTFFVNGANYQCIYDQVNVDRLRRSFEQGHQIASHTWSHAHLSQLSEAQIDYEIQRLDEAFVKILGVRPKFLRPPYGDIDERSASYIQNKYGKTIVLWSDDSGDSTGGSAQQSYNMYNGFANQGPGHPHMALSHETQQAGIDALRMGTVTRINQAGIRLVTVEQCLANNFPAYEYVGGYGTRDSTWDCYGPWSPGTPPNNGGCRTTYYSVAGDNCNTIGAKYGLTGTQIYNANTFLNCNDVWVGTPICIPNGGSGTPPTSTSTTSSTPAPTCVSRYTSVAGDNCNTIGAKYGLTGTQIFNANTFLNCNDVWVGTSICIPPGGTPPTSSTTSSTPPQPSCVSTYRSVSGDTCNSIGTKYGLTGTQIYNANTFLNCNDIWVNTPICIPPGGSACTQTINSVAGATCDSIGAQYGVSGAQILAWNTFLNCNDIWTGTPVVSIS
ncbi:glycoside hydrolase/deacetylase [Serendipita vermifera]|nr:glycoside hydrolase/deacetylase [Serendipita vermifera]